ncbi:hypothetical protein BaRGS_00015748 [Batillaria attramentaria]|uniref:Protein ZIP4 homolog n=1 Tax=Batillaria attramentaria TaxID=370345 RepID=A0ABD0L154_9CAEN
MLDTALQKTSELTTGLCVENKSNQSALDNAAVELWNKTVLMKTKGCLPNAAIAKLRQACFRMVTFSCGASKDELALRKQIVMGMKTAKAWIDCQQFENAENVLELVNQMIQSLHSIVVEKTSGQRSGTQCAEKRLSVEEDIFKVTCFKMEATSYLSLLCYNLGLNTYHNKQYDICTVWLRESYDLGKTRSTLSPKTQAKTLRLLANAYLDWNDHGCVEKALNAVTLANTEYLNPAGLYLKLRIMLMAKENASAIRCGSFHPDTVVDLCHSVILLLQKYSMELDGCPMASSSLERYSNTPEHGRLLTAYLDLLLRCKSHNAKPFARECIIAHNTDRPMDATTKKQFHILFWEQASKAFEVEQRFSDALDWYNYSLSLFRSGSEGGGSNFADGNMAKLHRNRASCYIGLQQLSQAKEALSEAKVADPSSVHTSFLFYKLALVEADLDTAKSSLKEMVEKQNDALSAQDMEESNNLISLAAQMAMEVPYSKLLVLSESEDKDADKLRTETAWFTKVAWNLALKSEEEPGNMKEFFILCNQKCILEEALRHIAENKSLDTRLMDGSLPNKSKEPAQILVLLYEFEALTKLGDARAESVLERALVLPNPEPKLFESFAALAVEHPAHQPRLSMRALKVAIHTHLQAEEPDFTKCSCGSYTEAEKWCAMSMHLLPHMDSLRDTYEEQMMSVYADILDGIEKHRSSRGLEE